MTDPVLNLMYIAPPFLTLLVNLILIFVVWRTGRKNSSSRLFIWFLVSMALWSFILFGMRSSPDLRIALWWERAIPVATCASFVLFYHFSIVYSNLPRNGILLRFAYLLLIAIIVISPTGLLIESMRLESYGYAPNVGPAVYPLFLGYILLLAGGVYHLLRSYRRSVYNDERNRLIYIIFGAIFLLIGMLLDALSNLPPLAVWTNLLFCIIASVAIVKYHLLDIRVVARKSLMYLVVSAIAAVPFAIIVVLGSEVITPGAQSWPLYLLLIIILAVIMRPAYGWAQNLVDRFYFRNRYDNFRALDDFSQETHKLNDVNQIGDSLVRLIKRALHSSSSYLLLPATPERFEVVSTTEEEISRLYLSTDSSLLRWLRDNKTILYQRDLYVIPQLQSFISTGLKELGGIKAELFVPILTKEQNIIGLIILGKKLSGQLYSQEDERLLLTVANRMAIELDNARLYGEIKRTSTALSESEEKTRRVFESVTDAILVTDLKSNILDCNDGACKMVGCASKVLIIGRNLSDFIAPFEYDRMRVEVDRALREGIVSNFEATALRIDGSEFPVEAGAGILRDNTGATIGFVVIVRDITIRKQMEAKIVEMEALKRTNQAKSELLANVSHELRTPLASIKGFIETLIETDVKWSQEQQMKFLKLADKETDRLTFLIGDLLDMSRLDSGKLELDRRYYKVSEILDSVSGVLSVITARHKLRIASTSDLPPVQADKIRIGQVITNLVENAAKFTPDGGSIAIEAKLEENKVIISIEDSGMGMPPEVLANLFNRFYQAFEVVKGKTRGTGLGLAICKGIVEAHGGNIRVESKQGMGSKFFFSLPLN